MNGIIRRLAGALAILLLAALLAGVPLLLWQLSLPVLPQGVPSWNQITGALLSQDDGTLIVILLVVVAWLAWAYLAIALLVEIWAAIRRVPAPRLRGFSLPQGVAHRLVSAALLAFIAVPTIGSLAYADTGTNDTSTTTQTSVTATPHAVEEAVESVVDAKPTAAERETVRHTVTPSDTLIGLAEQYLGDGARYMEIFNDNKGMVQANGRRLVDPDLIVDGTALTITLDTTKTPSKSTDKEKQANAKPEETHTPPPSPAETTAAAIPTTAPKPSPTPTSAPTTISTQEAAANLRAVVQQLEDEQTDAAVGIRTSFGVGALAAAGVVSLIGARRYLQRRTRRRGAMMAMPVGPAALIEQELRATANPMAIEEVDLALRSLAAHCREAGTALPEIRVARLTATTLELYTTEPELLPAPWIATADGRLWSYDADTADLNKEALAEIPAPYPALVCLGQDLENAHILVDLETVTEINVAGPQHEAEEILAAMAIELATSQWADDLNVTLVGAFPEMEDVLQTGRIRYLPTVGRLFEELQRRADSDRLHLNVDDVTDPHHARITAVAPSTWFPEIIMLTRPLTTQQTEQLDRLLTELPRVAIASVAISEKAGEWSINLQDDGTAIIEPLQLAITPQMVSTDAYQRVLEIVDIANNGQKAANETNPQVVDSMFAEMTAYLNTVDLQPKNPAHAQITTDDEDTPEEEPSTPSSSSTDAESVPSGSTEVPHEPLGPAEGIPYLRVLGPVELVGAEGPVEPNRAARLTEFLAFLMLTDNPITGRQCDDAIWPNRKKEDNSSTRAPATSRLRKWLGATPDGQLRLDVNNFQVSEVGCDWHEFAKTTDGPLDKIPTEQLAAALTLVRGTPFKSAAVKNLYYSWAEPIQQTMVSRIVDVVYELATRQLVDEDWLECETTLSIGIDIEPGDEELWRMRILAAYARHNKPAMEEATARLFAQLEAFDVAPEPQTTEFLRCLDDGADVTDLMEKI